MHPHARMWAAIAAAWIAPLLLAALFQRYLKRGAPAQLPPLRGVCLGIFTLGAVSLVLSQLLQRVLMAPWQGPLPETPRLLVEASFGAGIPEEAAKFPLILALIHLSKTRTPGAVVLRGLTVGLGFAAYENSITAIYGDPFTVFTNRVTSTLAHGFWGVIAAWYIGRAYQNPQRGAVLILLGFLAPTLLHTVEDFLIGISIPGSLADTGAPVPLPDAEPTAREMTAALGALGVGLAQGFWCWRIVRSCRSPRAVAGNAAAAPA